MNVEQKRRELFESTTILPTGVEWDEGSKSYVGTNYWLAMYAWSALNRAIDAVVIELPENKITFQTEERFNIRQSTIAQCRAAIESTGLGLMVKP